MSGTGLLALQIGVIARLRATIKLRERVTGIYDEVPQNKKYNYVVYDEPTEAPDRTLGQDGHRCAFSITIYTQDGSLTTKGAGSAGYREGLEIAELIVNALTDLDHPVAVNGHDLVDLDVESVDGFREDSGTERRVQIVFVALLEDAQ